MIIITSNGLDDDNYLIVQYIKMVQTQKMKMRNYDVINTLHTFLKQNIHCVLYKNKI